MRTGKHSGCRSRGQDRGGQTQRDPALSGARPASDGRLLASAAYLSKRGWKSADVITRAKRELLQAGFIHETVKGHRPNKASWYAVTWQALDRVPGYDAGAAEAFRGGAYRQNEPLKIATLLIVN